MRGQHHETDHLARHALIQQIAHGEEIAQGFGHFLTLDLQHFIMHPNIGKARALMGAAALRDLVLMMREHQIIAAAMNIEMRSQQFVAHGRAFNMPPRTAITPWAVPSGRVRIGWFPQHEIHRIAFIGGHLDPRACDHILDCAP